jgi:signal peptidase I
MSEEKPQRPANAALAQRSVVSRTHALGLLREVLETVVLAVLVFLIIQTVWRNFWVEGQSMEPNVHNGQYVVVDHLIYATGFPVNILRSTIGRSDRGRQFLDRHFHSPQRGDVIVFVPPTNSTHDYIKRVIGIPGDRVEIKQSRVYVNGQALNEPYILPGGVASWGPVVVGTGELFVMGDNRGNSNDSRAFGMLKQTKVVGKAWLCYWPPQRWGLIRHYDLGAQLAAR